VGWAVFSGQANGVGSTRRHIPSRSPHRADAHSLLG
jgi:hypothetical protein